ncbi:MAG: isoprenylcysteine carboxylmethyltransferase family protein [Chloroflexi bacterium]|nr:MAG: isoprenylcysteine carboxylmethyltransferase family protein [Chloroflexota bacterium]
MARESSAQTEYWDMNPSLVTIVSIGSIVTFMVVAQVSRARGLVRRGETVARSGGLAHYVAYFFFVPYIVIAVRPGPELDMPDLLRWIGLALIVAGVGFSLWAIATLGRHYDLELEIHRDHELVRRGPYRFVRHPVYTGLGLHFLGACLATGNLLLIAGTLLVTFPALYLRAKTEERLLRERFGAAYDEYARRVGMLVPLL